MAEVCEKGCGNHVYARGMCQRHYNAWHYRQNSTATPRRKGSDPNWVKKPYPAIAKKYQTSAKGRATRKKWRTSNKDRLSTQERAGFLRRKYGLTLEEYEKLFMEQGGVCGVCCATPPKGKPLCVDHCHRTKRVRGLLCHGCNLTVGFLEKNPDRTLAAFEYLRRYP